MRAAILALILSMPAQAGMAQDVVYRFAWTGDNGYAMTGAMSFDPALAGRLVLEDEVSCFEIAGTKDGQPIGRWALTMLHEETSWRLHFDARQERFLVEGDGVPMPQAWNMNGAGDDCGRGGFGFNLGNLGQDFCVDNQPRFDSRIAPPTPFPAVRDDTYTFGPDACFGPDLLSHLGHLPSIRLQ